MLSDQYYFFFHFTYLFLAVLGLHCSVGFPPLAASGGSSLVVVRGLLIAWLFLLRSMGSRAHGFQ